MPQVGGAEIGNWGKQGTYKFVIPQKGTQSQQHNPHILSPRPEVSRTYNFGQVGSSEGQYFRHFLKPMALAGAGVDWETMDLDYLLPQRCDTGGCRLIWWGMDRLTALRPHFSCPFIVLLRFHAHFERLMASATDMEAGEAWAATSGPVRVLYDSLGDYQRIARRYRMLPEWKASGSAGGPQGGMAPD